MLRRLRRPDSTPTPPVKDGAHPCAVGTAPVDVQPGGQQDPILHGDGAVGEGGDEQLVPACGRRHSQAVCRPTGPPCPWSPGRPQSSTSQTILSKPRPAFPKQAPWNPLSTECSRQKRGSRAPECVHTGSDSRAALRPAPPSANAGAASARAGCSCLEVGELPRTPSGTNRDRCCQLLGTKVYRVHRTERPSIKGKHAPGTRFHTDRHSGRQQEGVGERRWTFTAPVS